ncbi:hypothetical protein [Cupriavidus basilensis]|uniref:hypothetical protein n=1 Tax=Cupriavidus basilensis TaxID=68895 RepID=UPI0039F66756
MPLKLDAEAPHDLSVRCMYQQAATTSTGRLRANGTRAAFQHFFAASANERFRHGTQLQLFRWKHDEPPQKPFPCFREFSLIEFWRT